MSIMICDSPFDPWQALKDHQASSANLSGQYGATAIFVGTMRDFNLGDTISSMTLEHYPGMTEKYLAKIEQEAQQRWHIINSLIIHRVGLVLPDQAIVLLAVWSAHRGDAFDACRYMMEELKSHAPFWKKEQLGNQQSRWLDSNSSGYLSTSSDQ